ncbi:type II toxin-antitoxin system VapC family toxin [Synechococcus sp. Cruz-9H2]|uniref:type II toxin-antitoxin system VapC family toxin n=1 Tax=unclassified Synechococcus TaxID=2626047 RepID=UPI0020CCF757|nr:MULTISPECIES: type II toxin-antitoxin system VapC family toxin [unclassified Synechococcus]MCP9820028.1 type II toxin-antitoxin system VapC family toxin [Synechococcus sp. Cruz-9H2]MCP9844334.1 type II toxin-antitoxin system VapC family toxin [Synechococcus sp. Edmonson 11F2]MCP9856458.1 type II toxin-antitoxin system VapC family toxin [Synechococcus sp. Cruz-9C9]MCP9863767.1 type II toxin-antitoxin system VapC family toxin [Synechococcus sp. Cruz-7E5]MCP9870938.1 type II toxin-antitoxin sy
MIVVDTNVVAYLLLPGPLTGAAEAWFEADPDWAAPPLWRSELRNVLTGYLRRGTLPLEQVIALQDQAEELLGAMEIPVTSERVFELVQRSTCSAYDCEFVAAALEATAPLITADRAVLNAFPEISRPLNQPPPTAQP